MLMKNRHLLHWSQPKRLSGRSGGLNWSKCLFAENLKQLSTQDTKCMSIRVANSYFRMLGNKFLASHKKKYRKMGKC